jgi:hypothetical protein
MISVEEINATFAKENREALAGMRQWILDIYQTSGSAGGEI